MLARKHSHPTPGKQPDEDTHIGVALPAMDLYFCPSSPENYPVSPHSIALPGRRETWLFSAAFKYNLQVLSLLQPINGQWKEKQYNDGLTSLSLRSFLLSACPLSAYKRCRQIHILFLPMFPYLLFERYFCPSSLGIYTASPHSRTLFGRAEDLAFLCCS